MSGRLIVLSNRIPTDAQPSGGLVVALHEALSERGGIWIGSSGEQTDEVRDGLREIASSPYRRLAFDLTQAEHEGFYLGYANAVLWPLFHHRADLISFEAGQREAYLGVNKRVAQLIAEVVQPEDTIWVHDYHFLPMAWFLRAQGLTNRIGFFLHIPFPNASDTPAFPDRKWLPDWLAAFDIVGLQTRRDVTACLDFLRGEPGTEMLLRGQLRRGERTFEVRSFPIGIDVDGFVEAARAAPPKIVNLSPNQKLILGVDRLDYSKGIPQRFEAFGHYLSERTEADPQATLIQIAPPSREDVEAYQDIREELERMAGSVNGEHADLHWTPIRYIRRGYPRETLAGLYRAAHACLVTPLADGMNLVAKEFVAAQDGADPGVLILSHFAGASEQLGAALMVSPYDAKEVGEAIQKALTMSLQERQARYLDMISTLRREDISWWTETFLNALTRRAPTLPEVA